MWKLSVFHYSENSAQTCLTLVALVWLDTLALWAHPTTHACPLDLLLPLLLNMFPEFCYYRHHHLQAAVVTVIVHSPLRALTVLAFRGSRNVPPLRLP